MLMTVCLAYSDITIAVEPVGARSQALVLRDPERDLRWSFTLSAEQMRHVESEIALYRARRKEAAHPERHTKTSTASIARDALVAQGGID